MKKRPIRIMILYWSRKKSHARSTIRIPYRIFSVELTRNSQKNSYKIWHHWQETDSVIMNGNGEGTRCWPAAIVMVAVRVNAEALFNNLFFFSFVRSLLFSFLFFSSFFFFLGSRFASEIDYRDSKTYIAPTFNHCKQQKNKETVPAKREMALHRVVKSFGLV